MDAAAAGILQFPHGRIITQIQFTSIRNLNRSTKRSLVDLWAEKNAIRSLFTSDVFVPAYVCRQFPVCVHKINKNYYILQNCYVSSLTEATAIKGHPAIKKPHIRRLVHFPHDVHNVCFTILENMTNHSGDVDKQCTEDSVSPSEWHRVRGHFRSFHLSCVCVFFLNVLSNTYFNVTVVKS